MPARRVLPVFVLLSACPVGDPCEGTEGVAPSLVLGEGPDGFARELEPGDTMAAAFGPQGGFHVWPAVRTTGFAPGLPGRGPSGDRDLPTFEASIFAGPVLIESVETIRIMQGNGASAELGLFVLPVGDDPAALDGATSYRLEVRGADVCGTTLEAAEDVFIFLEP
ncbi:MAG: hypothetical protein AAF211_11205 [Myxococcota bacterium]